MEDYFKINKKTMICKSIIKYLNYGICIYVSFFLSNFVNSCIYGNTVKIESGIVFVLSLMIYYVLKYLLEYYIENRFTEKKISYKNYIYGELVNESYENMEKIGFGKVEARLSKDVENITGELCEGIVGFFCNMLLILTCMGILMFCNKYFTVLILVLAIFYAMPTIITRNNFQTFFEEYEKAYEIIPKNISETIDGFEFIKQNQQDDYFIKRYYMDQRKLAVACNKIDKVSIISESMKDGIENLCTITIYVILMYMLKKNFIKFGDIIYYTMISQYSLQSFRELFSQYNTWQKGKISIRRVQELFHGNSANSSENLFIKNVNSIKLDHVQFNYNEDKEILKDISMDLERGDKILIWGENGSGKSTLMRIVMGLYSRVQGKIQINGHKLSEINLTSYLRKISYMSQEQFSCNNDVESNIELFCHEKNSVDDLSSYFNIQLEKLKKQSWDKLSGGERQKICILRSILKDSDIIIMDEPTNNLDEDSVKKLVHLIKKDKRIVIIVSHDHRIDKCMDKKITLKNGEMICG